MTTRLSEVFLVLLFGLLSLHCGAVGEPRPPLLNIPERAEDPRVHQTPQGLVIEWTWPRMTTEGFPLEDLARFDVYGVELAPGSPVPDAGFFDRESHPLASIAGDDLKPYGPGDRVRVILDAAPLLGKLLVVGVRAESKRGRTVGFSDLTLVEVLQPPAQTARPDIRLAPDAIVIEWTAAQRATAYVVERSLEASGPFAEIGRADVTELRDQRFENGKTYFYRVRAIARSSTGEAEGLPSEPASVMTRDVFPPQKPAGLRAVATETAVELSWEKNQEPDVAGYRLLRRDAKSEFKPVQAELLDSPSFGDVKVASGQEYFYQVVAVDEAGNESAGSDPIQVRIP